MKVDLRGVAMGRREHALPETSVSYESGRAVLVCEETEQRPTVLGLLASGRMRPDAGSVHLDGRPRASALRRRTALVDAPGVSEPDVNIVTAGVVAEELMFAGRRSDPFASRRWLTELGLGALASVPVSNIEPAARMRILCELAVLRKGVEGIVLVSPDRHGGEPAVWWSLAEELAARGFAVLVIAGRASQSALDARERDQVREAATVGRLHPSRAPRVRAGRVLTKGDPR